MAKLVETRLLRRLLFDVLKPTSESGDNPYLVTVNGEQMWIYIKNLSPAYFSNPDVWRAQLPKRDIFEKCKISEIPFILLGYDDEHDVYTIWNHRFVKQRLNVADSVSFYSRASLQQRTASNNELNRLSLANDMEVICFPRLMVSEVISNLGKYFPNDDSNYVALNSKRRTEANNSFKLFTSIKNIPSFIDYLLNVKQYSKPTTDNYSGAIRRFISKGIFTKYRADFLTYDNISDYHLAMNVFFSHEDVKELNISSRHVHSNALTQYIDFLCLSHSDSTVSTDNSDLQHLTDWEGEFINEFGKLTRIANPKLIELLRPELQTDYPRVVAAYNIIADFYGSRFETTMDMKDWSKLIDNIDWNYNSPAKQKNSTNSSPQVKKWSKKGRLSVTYPNGTVISYPNSTKTFLEVIENSYPDLIIEMGIEVNGGNLIHTSNDKPRLQEIKGGFYVDVNYRTDLKVQILKQISDELELKLLVEQLETSETDSEVSNIDPAIAAIIIPSTPQNQYKRDRIKVTFSDGYSICEKNSKITFVAAIKRIGINAVFELKINAWETGTIPLMSEQPISGYEDTCAQLAPDRYLFTNSSNQTKVATLQRISGLLNLNLKIEILEGVNKKSNR
jgi:hypothetical protein